jgi:AraC-like DNA-binding protein
LLAGYADSTHFSHAIREFTGIKPKDIVAAMRGIPVVRPQEPAKQTATRIRAARSSKSAPCRGA